MLVAQQNKKNKGIHGMPLLYLMLAYADLSWKTLSSIVSFTSG